MKTKVSVVCLRNHKKLLPCVKSSANLFVSDTFDVAIVVTALDICCIPVSVVREICCATKPGNHLTLLVELYVMPHSTLIKIKELLISLHQPDQTDCVFCRGFGLHGKR